MSVVMVLNLQRLIERYRVSWMTPWVGKIILDKFSSVLAKGISNILSLDATDKDNNDLDPEHISSLKYAPITSVDVERTFSTYK
jgi:hypothetical protein